MIGVSGARSCARRLHHVSVSLSSSTPGPSRLPAPSICRCQASSTSNFKASPSPSKKPACILRPRSIRNFTSSAPQSQDEATSPSPPEKEDPPLFTGESKNAVLTLEYLDSLKPSLGRASGKRRSKRALVSPFGEAKPDENEDSKLWKRTQDLISSSFTRAQLMRLAKEANLPGGYSHNTKKGDLVRRIMVHRFGMVDAQEKLDRIRREERSHIHDFIEFKPAELFLLLCRGSTQVREQARKASVALLPRGPPDMTREGNPQLGFWIKGKEQGNAQMKDWANSFKQTIETKQESVMLFDPSNDLASQAGMSASQFVPPKLSQYISSTTGCFVEVGSLDQGRLSLTLFYQESQDAEQAMLMLRQFQSEFSSSSEKVGAAAYADNVDALRQYSMVPFVSSGPSQWHEEVNAMLTGSNPELAFRVAHVPDLDTVSISTTTAFPKMKLIGWEKQGEVALANPFQRLFEIVSSVPQNTEQQLSAEYSAVLGHVLFPGNVMTLQEDQLSEDEFLQKMEDPLAAPRSGIWPFEHITEWAKDFRRKWGREAARFAPTTFLRPYKDASEFLWLERQGWRPINDKAGSTEEKLVLTYQLDVAEPNLKPKLEVILKMLASSDEWEIESARWISATRADVMVPERCTDLQLSAKCWTDVSAGEQTELRDQLQDYLKSTSHRQHAKETTGSEDDAESDEAVELPVSSSNSRRFVLPPSRLDLGAESGAAMLLDGVKKVIVQAWHQRPPATSSPTKAPVERKSAVSETEEKGEEDSGTTPQTDSAPVPEAEGDALVGGEPANEAKTESSTDLPLSETEQPQMVHVEDSKPLSETTPEPKPRRITSPMLVQEIIQDPITEATTQTLKLTWVSSATEPIPSWESGVHLISTLIEKYDSTIV